MTPGLRCWRSPGCSPISPTRWWPKRRLPCPTRLRRRRVRRMLDELAVLVERFDVIDQARCRVNGEQPDGATRLVSLHEPDAHPDPQRPRPRQTGRVRLRGQVVANTSTGSSSITACTSATRPTTGCYARRSNVSTPPSEWPRHWSPPTRLLGHDHRGRPGRRRCDDDRHPAHRQAVPRARAAIEHADTFVAAGEVARRLRRPDLAPKRDWAWQRTTCAATTASGIRRPQHVAHNLVKINNLRQ